MPDKLTKIRECEKDIDELNVELRKLCKVELNGLASKPTQQEVKRSLLEWLKKAPIIKTLTTVFSSYHI